MYLIIPLVICVIGLFVYAFVANPKLAECGRLAFAVGLLVTVWQFAGHALTVTR